MSFLVQSGVGQSKACIPTLLAGACEEWLLGHRDKLASSPVKTYPPGSDPQL